MIVANAGRRPITVTDVRARHLFPARGYVSLACHPKIPFELKEGKQLSALADDEKIDIAEIQAWEVHDAVGHIYRMNVAPLHLRIWSRVLKVLKP